MQSVARLNTPWPCSAWYYHFTFYYSQQDCRHSIPGCICIQSGGLICHHPELSWYAHLASQVHRHITFQLQTHLTFKLYHLPVVVCTFLIVLSILLLISLYLLCRSKSFRTRESWKHNALGFHYWPGVMVMLYCGPHVAPQYVDHSINKQNIWFFFSIWCAPRIKHVL